MSLGARLAKVEAELAEQRLRCYAAEDGHLAGDTFRKLRLSHLRAVADWARLRVRLGRQPTGEELAAEVAAREGLPLDELLAKVREYAARREEREGGRRGEA